MAAKTQDIENVHWDDVRVFLAAFRQRSLGAAAMRLGVDTSTVSRRLGAFEEALGVKLFERTREGLLQTRAAERVLAAAEAMEVAHSRLARDAAEVETLAEGIVRLSVAPGMADLFVAPLLARLRRKHPRLSIELDASVQPRDLTRHEADLAIRSVQPRGAELVTTKIGSGQWVPAASPALVEELGRVKAWTDVPWISWDRDLASFGPSRWLAQHAAKADVVLRTSQFSAQIAAARTSLGALLVPEPYLRPLGLAAVQYARALAPTIAAAPEDDLWLVCHRVLRDLPRVAAVWTFLADEMRALMRA
jgi:DNA-binding transcriptional LysR family regulator